MRRYLGKTYVLKYTFIQHYRIQGHFTFICHVSSSKFASQVKLDWAFEPSVHL